MRWEDFLSARALGFLLPYAELHGASFESATTLLDRLTGKPKALRLLRLAATLAPCRELLDSFGEAVASLVACLPSRSSIHARQWEGGFHGRLDVRATQLLHANGQRTAFVTREPVRTFDFPENVLLRAVVHELVAVIRELREHAAIQDRSGWGQFALAAASRLEHLVASSRLRAVPLIPARELGPVHRASATAARHSAYRMALDWLARLADGVDSTDPQRIARVLSQGSLWPVSEDVRFEIAVVVRLVEALNERLVARCGPGTFDLVRSVVIAGRNDVAAFQCGPRQMRIFYNQAVLPSGSCERGTARYVGIEGRMRPDVTITVDAGSTELTAFVLEVKRTPKPSYVAEGYAEAVLYRWEYASRLRSWPKAVVVTSCPLPPTPLERGDDVLAVDWAHWVSDSLADAILQPLIGD